MADATLKITYLEVGALKGYERNARTHSEAQIAEIAASIQAFGWTNPILVDESGGIIAGHGRLAAALSLGLETVATICIAGLSDVERRALVLVDNKLALNAGWDEDALRVELGDLQGDGFDLALLGFTGDELAALMRGADFEPGAEEDQGRLDQKAPIMCPNCGHEF